MPEEKIDILQIIKYHAGELDAKAMHQLEMQAQRDPFLMEAMEGYENIASNHESILADIKQRLHKRVNPVKGRIIPWRMLSIAASLVLLMSVLVIFWFRSNNNQEKRLASNVPAPVQSNSKAEKADTIQKMVLRKTISKSKTNADKNDGLKVKGEFESLDNKELVSVKKKKEKMQTSNFFPTSPLVSASDKSIVYKNTTTLKDSTPLNEMIVMDMAARKEEQQASLAKVAAPKKQPAPLNQVLQSKADGVTKSPLTYDGINNSNLLSDNAIISGKVVGKDGGFPVVGAIVKVTGTSNQTVTDDKGAFTIKTNAASDKIVVGYLGYESKQVSVANKDSVKKIELNPVNNALAEVIVVDYNKKINEGESTLKRSHPKIGWGNYRSYLKASETFTVGIAGVVKIGFDVDHDGNISNIKIIESLNDVADKKSIDLVKTGPAWIGNTSGVPEKVTLGIKFLK